MRQRKPYGRYFDGNRDIKVANDSQSRDMTKQSLSTVALSVVLSVVASTAANLLFDRQREPVLPDVVRAKRVELIDAEGRVRGTFELADHGHFGVTPHLIMRDADGRDSIYMGLDVRGDGSLAFANDYWNGGSLILGHLKMSTMEQSPKAKTSKTSREPGVFESGAKRISSPASGS
jgi:hypothetical protein